MGQVVKKERVVKFGSTFHDPFKDVVIMNSKRYVDPIWVNLEQGFGKHMNVYDLAEPGTRIADPEAFLLIT